VRVGYAGDPHKRRPTYHDLGGHAEALQVDFDPAVTSFDELLDLFWQSHDAFRPSWSGQYRSIAFFHTPEQEAAARRSRERLAGAAGRVPATEILPGDTFWPAEQYHQKYRLQHHQELNAEYRAIYPAFVDYLDSTAVARVNGYLGGEGRADRFEQELPLLGLSAAGQQRLRRAARLR
jgi:peptide-methionine (S)-S-oxide reductase